MKNHELLLQLTVGGLGCSSTNGLNLAAKPRTRSLDWLSIEGGNFWLICLVLVFEYDWASTDGTWEYKDKDNTRKDIDA